MTYAAEDILLISVPLTSKDQKIARGFANEQNDLKKQEQVYRNTLAVLVTHRYFSMLGIPSELKASSCWNSTRRKEQDIADLFVSEIENWVECRPIHSDDDRCYVPREVWQDRAGYVVVELRDGEQEGIIRGFVPEVSIEQLPLSYLRPLDLFFEIIALGPAKQLSKAVETLRNWISGEVGPEWLSPRKLPKSIVMVMGGIARSPKDNDKLDREIATLPKDALAAFVEQTQDDVTRWKAAEILHQVSPEHPSAATVKAKDLGMYLSGHKIALLVGIIMKPDGRALIMTRVYPMENLGVLPCGLTLSGHSLDGKTLFEVQSRQHDDYIQFLFTMDIGDKFMLQLSFGTASITESFIV